MIIFNQIDDFQRLANAAEVPRSQQQLISLALTIIQKTGDFEKGAKFFTCDLKDFYLATPMEKPEFMKISAKHIPEDIYHKYNIGEKITKDNNVFIKINKGMYGLRQAAVLAYNKLVKHLAKHGYHPIEHTVGLWTHISRPIKFCLCVDDFGVKYFNTEDAHHLVNALNEEYVTSVDFTGSHFCGLRIDWDYHHNHVDISMPNYIAQLLKKLNYDPKLPQYSPFPTASFTITRKGQRQYAQQPDHAPLLSIQDTTKVQSIVGSLLYYARAIDCTLLTALNTIAANQSAPTETTLKQCYRLLDYAATYPASKIRFYASPMILNIDSNAAYLVSPKARSRIAGYFTFQPHRDTPIPHGPLLVECKTLRHVVASSAEAEIAGVFHNAQIAIPIRYMLLKLDHPQPATPIKTDKTTVNSFVKDNVTQKRSKSWDMRYYWLREKQSKQQFSITWDRATTNLADYFTKHFSGKYHRKIRSKYIHDDDTLRTARVC